MTPIDILIKIFGIRDGVTIRENAFIPSLLGAGVTNSRTFVRLKKAIEKDGLEIEGIAAAGRQAFLFKIKGIETGLLRLESDQNSTPLDHPLIIRPVFRKKYATKDASGGDEYYSASLVPITVGLGVHEDYLRTCVNFQSKNPKESLENRFSDVDVTQISYLKHDNGELMTYADGKPIAFFHDINSATSEEPRETKAMGTFTHSFEAYLTQIRALLGEIPGESSTLSEEARQKLRDGQIANIRSKSDMGSKIKDETEFLRYMKKLYTEFPKGSQEDIDAAKQQTEALIRLRAEAEKLKLPAELKEQLDQRSAWEIPPTQLKGVVVAADVGSDKSVAI